MPTYSYQPYYQYNGPTRADPFREELPTDEAERRIDALSRELGHYFSDMDALVGPLREGVIDIQTEIAQADCDERVSRALNSLDLFARKVRQK